jgi:hypothetical protein
MTFPEASRAIRETDLASDASGAFDPAGAGSGPSQVAGSHLATSQEVALAIVYASQPDPPTWFEFDQLVSTAASALVRRSRAISRKSELRTPQVRSSLSVTAYARSLPPGRSSRSAQYGSGVPAFASPRLTMYAEATMAT